MDGRSATIDAGFFASPRPLPAAACVFGSMVVFTGLFSASTIWTVRAGAGEAALVLLCRPSAPAGSSFWYGAPSSFAAFSDAGPTGPASCRADPDGEALRLLPSAARIAARSGQARAARSRCPSVSVG